MTLLQAGLAAAGIACVAIPILIHLLLRRRRRPIEWAAMRFLLEAYRRQRNRLKLQQLLLLATRCLILLLFALAVGRLVLDGTGLLSSGAGRDLYLLVDNSLASQLRDEAGTTALDRHKTEAAAMLDALGSGDRASLVALGAPAEVVVGSPSSDIPAVRSLVEAMEPTASRADVGGALERIASVIESEDPSRRAQVMVLSDFLAGSADPSRPLPPALAELANVRVAATKPAERAPGNVQVVSLEPLNPVVLTGSGGVSRGEQVRIGLRRTGAGAAREAVTTVRLRTDDGTGESIAPPVTQSVRWSAGETEKTVTMQIDAVRGEITGVTADTLLVAEVDRDALEADNVMRRPIGVRESLRVGMIARRRFDSARRVDQMSVVDWLRLALNPTETDPIDIEEIEPATIDAPALAAIDVAVLPSPDLVTDEGWSLLGSFVRAGGLLMVMPPADAEVHLWPDSLREALGSKITLAREVETHTEEPLALSGEAGASPILSWIGAELEELVKPVTVSRLLPVLGAPADAQTVLSLGDGRPWVLTFPPGAPEGDEADSDADRGLVIYFASAPTLSWTNLPARPLMVPLVQESVRQGFGRSIGSWTTVAGRYVPAPARATLLEPVAGEARTLQVGETGLSTTAAREAGVWRAVDPSGRARGLVAVNPDPDAGRSDVQAPTTVNAWLTGAVGGAEVAREAGIDFLAPGQTQSLLERGESDSPWSRPLLIAALVLAVLETFMARWFSYARRERGRRRTAEAPEAAPA